MKTTVNRGGEKLVLGSDYKAMHREVSKDRATCHTPAQLYNITWNGQVVRRNLERGKAYAIKANLKKSSHRTGKLEVVKAN